MVAMVVVMAVPPFAANGGVEKSTQTSRYWCTSPPPTRGLKLLQAAKDKN